MAMFWPFGVERLPLNERKAVLLRNPQDLGRGEPADEVGVAALEHLLGLLKSGEVGAAVQGSIRLGDPRLPWWGDWTDRTGSRAYPHSAFEAVALLLLMCGLRVAPAVPHGRLPPAAPVPPQLERRVLAGPGDTEALERA